MGNVLPAAKGQNAETSQKWCQEEWELKRRCLNRLTKLNSASGSLEWGRYQCCWEIYLSPRRKIKWNWTWGSERYHRFGTSV